MVQQDIQPPAALSQQATNTMIMDNDASEPNEAPRSDLPLANDSAECEEEIMLDDAPLDDSMLDDALLGGPARIYTPPPHIAARFYRTSQQAHRKGSAASSRRNSISSNHSRSSHGYGLANSSNTAPQSKHVAQHLRRASILADRKARLADRAAHAEQVRLRAAMAKAAVRDISQSEERALAAAQAREKKLEEIAATCAEEVKRAKAIAESIKEKREQELLRVRQQIQDRLDLAERRREELRRNAGSRTRTRGQSVNSSRKQVEVMPLVAELKETSPQDQSRDVSPGSTSSQTDGRDSPSRDTPAPDLTPDEAACKILHWWRRASRKKAISKFHDLGLAIDSVRDTSFETVVDMLGQDSVLMTTGKVLRLCGIQDGKTSSVKEIVVIRTFLSAFLILGHPTQVLTNKENQEAAAALAAGPMSANSPSNSHAQGSIPIGKGDLSNPKLQELVSKAKDLLICFETNVSRLTHANNYTPSPSLASELVDAYDSFYEAFIAWKARDASALVDVMVLQFVELDAIWQTVKDGTNPSVSATYRESIQQNQLLLMVRIKKLAGPEAGKKKIFEAVRKARRAKDETRRTAAAASAASREMQPRETEGTIETAMGDLTGEAARAARNCKGSASTSLSDTGESGASAKPTIPVSDAAISRMLPQLNSSAETRVDDKLRSMQFLPNDKSYSSSPLPENRVIIHELAMDHEYRVSPTEYSQSQIAWMEPVFHRMKKTMSAETRPEKDEHFFYLLAIADCMRSKLERLTVTGRKMHQFIGELLDTEVAQRQFAMGSFSFERFASSIGALLPKLCAPVRDAEVKELLEVKLKQGDYVDGLRALLSFIDIMVTDHVNFMIHVAAPRLLESATQYETRYFENLMAQGASGNNAGSKFDANGSTVIDAWKRLPVSLAVWKVARGKVLSETAKRDPEGVNHPKSRPTMNQFYTQMLIDVFVQVGNPGASRVPEMLRLDTRRIAKCIISTRHIVTAGAVLLQCKSLLKRNVRLPWKTEARRVLAVLAKAEADLEEQLLNHRRAPTTTSTDDVIMRSVLCSSTVIDGVVAALESGRAMPPTTKAHMLSFVKRTITASAEAAVFHYGNTESGAAEAALQEPVLRLLLHRLRGFLASRLTIASTSEKSRQSNAINEHLAGLGLAEFSEQVREMTDVISRVGAIDRDTHVRFWEAVDEHVSKQETAN